MTTLAEKQEAFLAALLDEDAALPRDWGERQGAGMHVYRGNYRAALLKAMRTTYERTNAALGDRAFTRAAINHAIAHPPTGWTLDAAGEGFAETCVRTFPERADAAELARLEWRLLELATAADSEPMTQAEFADASAGFGDADWMELRLAIQPRAEAFVVRHDLEALWREPDGQEDRSLDTPRTCLAYREGERTTFAMLDADHAAAFEAMRSGTSYGQLIGMLVADEPEPSGEEVQAAAMRAGTMLGEWLGLGVVTGLNP